MVKEDRTKQLIYRETQLILECLINCREHIRLCGELMQSQCDNFVMFLIDESLTGPRDLSQWSKVGFADFWISGIPMQAALIWCSKMGSIGTEVESGLLTFEGGRIPIVAEASTLTIGVFSLAWQDPDNDGTEMVSEGSG